MPVSWRGMIRVPQGPAPSSSSHLAESGSSSVPFPVLGRALSHNPSWGLAFDSTRFLYAADGGAQTIYKFAPNGTRTVFVGPSVFAPGAYPMGLAFDSSGNLFVSIETFTDPGADSIVYFTPTGVKSIFATGLTFPWGLAFDSSGNLFVAEANAIPDGDILKFDTGGPHVFASGFGRPEFLTFGPPRQASTNQKKGTTMNPLDSL
jgi:DNA-binding beta-propeller fold protein YncE